MKRLEISLTKITLALLLLLCLLDMPYGFYELVRFLALMGFGFLSYKHFRRAEKKTAFIYAAFALLFQPFFKIALGRELWNILDVIVAISLVVSVVNTSIKKNDLKYTNNGNYR